MKTNLVNGSTSGVIQSSTQTQMTSSDAVQFASYNEMADIPVTFKTLEEEFVSRLALVEDLHKRFSFMMTELKSAGLRSSED